METIEELPVINTTEDTVKTIYEQQSEHSGVEVEVDICHKSNGVIESADAGDSENFIAQNMTETALSEIIHPEPDPNPNGNDAAMPSDQCSAQSVSELVIEEVSQEVVPNIVIDTEDMMVDSTNDATEVNSENIVISDAGETTVEAEENECAIQSNDVEVNSERVTFETEILVESNTNEINENESKIEINDPNTNILSELGPNIELSEALRSSNVTDAVENNNCAPKQEMFNKEELLDILEGNDVADAIEFENVQAPPITKIKEAQLALQQLTRLKEKTKKTKRSQGVDKIPRKRRGVVKIEPESIDTPVHLTEDSKEVMLEATTLVVPDVAPEVTPDVTPEVNNEENIVNDLVKDWEDDEPIEEEQTVKEVEEVEESQPPLETSDKTIKTPEIVNKQAETQARTSVDSSTSDGQVPNLNKSADEGQPQKRLGRVIKKKVIFDPDNPDTFTKNKAANKNKETMGDKEEKHLPTPTKKIKIEQIIQRSKSKSPISKLQWKKPSPSPKNNKQNKRLTEVDKLLMDEGAVNMIYQLTPEAPKGKKNMKTKAEFIKKIQSSTPDSKEMKFRERKKDKYEEGEARKILGGKQRPSLNSSVKSPSVCEDFEAHSADDSIIYRRHSSSSYSSSCMSPRRLSDVETGQIALKQPSDTHNQAADETGDTASTDVFMADESTNSTSEIINKDDCLSIKEKLNSKLSLALNKRKREGTKMDKLEKSSKSKKITKTDGRSLQIKAESVPEGSIPGLKHLSVNLNESLAEICIRKSGSIYTLEVMSELEKALTYVHLNNTVSVTLLTSECDTLCSGLDLKPLLNENSEEQSKYAKELAEAMRRVVCAVRSHGRLVVAGAAGGGEGAGAALLAAADAALCSERAAFALPALQPAAAALHAALPPSMVRDMLLGRVLCAREAVQAGLVSRTLWPHRFKDQLQAFAADIARQPKHDVLMKKKLMQLNRSGIDTFTRCLEQERDLFVEYWTSPEGREAVRASLATT